MGADLPSPDLPPPLLVVVLGCRGCGGGAGLFLELVDMVLGFVGCAVYCCVVDNILSSIFYVPFIPTTFYHFVGTYLLPTQGIIYHHMYLRPATCDSLRDQIMTPAPKENSVILQDVEREKILC